MRKNKAGLVWIVLISFLSVLRLTFSLPVLVYKTEDVSLSRRGSALHFVDMDDGLLSMQRRGLSGTVPNQGSPPFVARNAQRFKNAVSRVGQAIRTQVSRAGAYARGATNPTHTGANFANYAAKKGAFGKKMK